MESILELVVTSMVVALAQAHSHKKLTGFSQTAEICHERSSQAPGVGLGRNCRSLPIPSRFVQTRESTQAAISDTYNGDGKVYAALRAAAYVSWEILSFVFTDADW